MTDGLILVAFAAASLGATSVFIVNDIMEFRHQRHPASHRPRLDEENP